MAQDQPQPAPRPGARSGAASRRTAPTSAPAAVDPALPNQSAPTGPADAEGATSALSAGDGPALPLADTGDLPAEELSEDERAAAELARVQPDPDDVRVVRTAIIAGIDETELAELGTPEIPVGIELACAPFEDGDIRTGRVVEVHLAQQGIVIEIDDLGWRWPVHIDRVNLALGEWTHRASDYPLPGADPEWDQRHRMSERERDLASDAVEADKRAADALKAEASMAAPSRATGAASAAMPAAPVTPPPNSVLATWKGPGSLSGPFVFEVTGKRGELAVAGTRGWFPARAVAKNRADFMDVKA